MRRSSSARAVIAFEFRDRVADPALLLQHVRPTRSRPAPGTAPRPEVARIEAHDVLAGLLRARHVNSAAAAIVLAAHGEPTEHVGRKRTILHRADVAGPPRQHAFRDLVHLAARGPGRVLEAAERHRVPRLRIGGVGIDRRCGEVLSSSAPMPASTAARLLAHRDALLLRLRVTQVVEDVGVQDLHLRATRRGPWTSGRSRSAAWAGRSSSTPVPPIGPQHRVRREKRQGQAEAPPRTHYRRHAASRTARAPGRGCRCPARSCHPRGRHPLRGSGPCHGRSWSAA